MSAGTLTGSGPTSVSFVLVTGPDYVVPSSVNDQSVIVLITDTEAFIRDGASVRLLSQRGQLQTVEHMDSLAFASRVRMTTIDEGFTQIWPDEKKRKGKRAKYGSPYGPQRR